MQQIQASKLRASDTRASLPGAVRLSFAKYVKLSRDARRDALRLFTACALLLAYAINALLVHKTVSVAGFSTYSLVLAALIGWLVYPAMKRYRRVRNYAMNGDLTPGKVVSISPYRVAVYTDVGMQGEFWPVIKVIDPHVDGSSKPYPAIGDRIPSISMYQGDLFETHWQDVSPIPVFHFTDDERVIDDCLQRLANHDGGKLWERLDAYLAKVRTPTELGLYTFGRIDI